MRYILLSCFCFSTALSFGQNSNYLDVILKDINSEANVSLTSFVTVFLNSDFKHTVRFYTNVYKKDSTFRIPNVSVGKYWLKFYSEEFYIAPFPIVVCSKCTNQFDFSAYPLKEGENRMIFEAVEVSPTYVGGYKALAKDLQKNLTKQEKKLLK